MSIAREVYLTGAGSYLPGEPLTNDQGTEQCERLRFHGETSRSPVQQKARVSECQVSEFQAPS